MSYEKLVATIRGSFFESLIAVALITIVFMALEPIVSRGQATDTFLVTQTIEGAIAIANSPISDLAMTGNINGLSGGTAYGTTTVLVTTNNDNGYNLTIDFSSTTAMSRGLTGEARILNYVYSTGTANYPAGFDVTPVNAQFGFTVNASNTAEISSVFTGAAGTACGTGAGTTFTLNDCWRGASTSDETADTELMNTSAPTGPTGSTSTVTFRVTLPNGPNPVVPNGQYVATATLTATDNP